MKDTIKLLRQCGAQFRYYAQQHLDKCPGIERELRTANARVDVAADKATEALRQQLAATRTKHEVNLRLAEQIEDHILSIENAAAPPSEQYMPQPITE